MKFEPKFNMIHPIIEKMLSSQFIKFCYVFGIISPKVG
jgi:hypothetical protein